MGGKLTFMLVKSSVSVMITELDKDVKSGPQSPSTAPQELALFHSFTGTVRGSLPASQ